MKMAEKISKRVENTVGKEKLLGSLRAISPFTPMFSKDLYSRQVKQGFVQERVKSLVEMIGYVNHWTLNKCIRYFQTRKRM